MLDLPTGIELELLLPKGATRFDLLERLAARFGAPVEPFEQYSKVPMPPLARDTVSVVQDVARHHDAKVQSIAPDLSCFYLVHRAGRIRGRLSVVHDNTIAGGERVAEVVTAPLRRDQLGDLFTICEAARSFEGVSIPDGAALHVHLDGAPFLDARPLSRLVQAYLRFESELFERVGRPEALRRAGPLPEGFADLLELTARRSASWEETAPLVAAAFKSRDHGLNLYNVGHDVKEKLTVELKIAGSTLDPDRIVEIRELYVRLADWALGEDPMPEALA